MKLSYKLLLVISLFSITLILVSLYLKAKKYSDFVGSKSVFSGPVGKMSFFVNSYNGYIMSNIPKNLSTPYLKWREVIPEAQILLDNFEDIKNEYLEVLKNYEKIPEYGEVDNKNTGLSGHDKKDWKTFVFKYHSDYNKKNCDLCPKTSKLLKELPIELAMFSIMEKGKKLYPHRGPSKHILRLHLGIVIPDKAKITVDNKDYYWKEKELMMFDDTYEHSVDNPNGLRGVLFMDIDRKHIPKKYIWLANLLGKGYFNKVNNEIEKKSSNL